MDSLVSTYMLDDIAAKIRQSFYHLSKNHDLFSFWKGQTQFVLGWIRLKKQLTQQSLAQKIHGSNRIWILSWVLHVVTIDQLLCLIPFMILLLTYLFNDVMLIFFQV